MIALQRSRIILPQRLYLSRRKVLIEDLVPWRQKVRPCAALQQVRGCDFAKRHGAIRLDAKDDHVGEVASFLFRDGVVAGVLPVNAAGRKDFSDGLNDDLGRREGEFARVVL